MDRAEELRRSILGDDYVDAAGSDEFQQWITSTAWGVWAREGPLSVRDRSLLVLAITASLGRMEEFRLHVGAAHRAGVTDEEVDELLFQLGAYAGGPAAISARRVVREVRAAR